MTNDELNRITEQAKAIRDAASEVMLSHEGLVVIPGNARKPEPLGIVATFERMGLIAEMAKQIHTQLANEPRRPTGRKAGDSAGEGQQA